MLPSAPPGGRFVEGATCMKKPIAALAAAATLLAGVAAMAPASAVAPRTVPHTGVSTAASISWGTCESPALQRAGAVCGLLSVPLDWNKPTGTKIKLAVSKIAHKVTAAKYQGVMLTNPGGPGGSGLTLSVLGSYIPDGVGEAYDWIGFDPRGVGSSIPALSCLPNYMQGPRPSYIPFTRSLTKTWLKRSSDYAAACGAHGGALLNHVKTTDSARDMDAIRVALGAEQINYYGFSYGTYLAQVYATMFPTHVRRMVLDSNVDPRRVWYPANLDQDVAFERNINLWFGWVAKHDSKYHLGKTQAGVHLRWYAEMAELRKAPASGVVGADEWTDIFLNTGYYQSTWADLADVFAAWANHDDLDTLVGAYEDAESVGDDNSFAMYNATQCSDVQWPTSWSTWSRDNWRTFAKAPYETWANVWFNAPCLTWPAKAGHPVTINGAKAPAILLVGETLDAATPFTGNLQVRKLFPRSRLIGEPGGTTHAGTLYGNDCVDAKIAAYLETGALPARKAGNWTSDAVCAPLPQPTPNADQLAPTLTKPGLPSRSELTELGRVR